MGMGFAPTWLRQVSPPPASQNQFNHCMESHSCQLGDFSNRAAVSGLLSFLGSCFPVFSTVCLKLAVANSSHQRFSVCLKSRLKTFLFTQTFTEQWSDLTPAPLKLRPYGAIKIRLSLLLLFFQTQHNAIIVKRRCYTCEILSGSRLPHAEFHKTRPNPRATHIAHAMSNSEPQITNALSRRSLNRRCSLEAVTTMKSDVDRICTQSDEKKNNIQNICS